MILYNINGKYEIYIIDVWYFVYIIYIINLS